MTQNERLRALLAEARKASYPLSWSADGFAELRQRIDAALAEPVLPEYTFRGGYIEDASGDRWWSAELLAKTERERDEARAEAEHWKVAAKQHDENHVAAVEACFRAGSERYEARVAEVEMLRGVGCSEDGDGPCGACIKCAYRRGAEAMREAAAQAVPGHYVMDLIRALPIPEDKPGTSPVPNLSTRR